MKSEIQKMSDGLAKKADLNHRPQIKFRTVKQTGGSIAYTDCRDIYLSRKLLRNSSKVVVKGIIAHEISHIVDSRCYHRILEHITITRYMSYFALLIAMLSGTNFGLAITLIGVIEIVNLLIELHVSRLFEYKADSLATRLTDKKTMIQTIEFLRQGPDVSAKIPNALRTHPKYQLRVVNILRTKI